MKNIRIAITKGRLEEYAVELFERIGIDCSELLAFGTPDDIKKEVDRIICSIGEYGGILLGSTSEIHNGVPPENCRYLYEIIKELGAGL
jgi:uroporphyrinogen-III decarboxylase